jgi:hypothetical protein
MEGGGYTCSDIEAEANNGELSPEFCLVFKMFYEFCGHPRFLDDTIHTCSLCPDIGVQNPYVPFLYANGNGPWLVTYSLY